MSAPKNARAKAALKLATKNCDEVLAKSSVVKGSTEDSSSSPLSIVVDD
jgi:hypothetical protein